MHTMDSGNFSYPFVLSYETASNKDTYMTKIRELADDFQCFDDAGGKLTFLVCFNDAEKHARFIQETGLSGFETISGPDAVKQKFFSIMDLS